MFTCKYVGSSGNVYEFCTSKWITRSANFHSYKWTMDSTTRQFGVKVDRFRKDPVSYNAKLLLVGNEKVNRETVEMLHDEFERDILTMKPGRIYHGDYYIDCFITESVTEVSDLGSTYVDNSIVIFCPYPFWVKEINYTISKMGDEAGTRYPYRYPIRYGKAKFDYINVDYFGESNLKIVAHGPFESMNMSIGNNMYSVDYSCNEDEYLVVDTREYVDIGDRCYVMKADGTKVNVFDYRAPESKLFNGIPGGASQIVYDGRFDIDITVYVKRSEPIWNR